MANLSLAAVGSTCISSLARSTSSLDCRISGAAVDDSDDEVIDWPETSDMPDHVFDYCFSIDLIASNDDLRAYRGYAIATESDEFEIYVINIMQKIISVEEDDKMLFMEEMIDENVGNDHVEESAPP